MCTAEPTENHSSASNKEQLTVRPVVSIIIPVFNRLKYLRASIDSVFKQSFLDWELLIADDGSDPETQDYLRTLDDRLRVRVLWLGHTGNPAAVRNTALREATGEYVAFLDSDDVWMPEKLQTQIESMRSHTMREWSYTGFTLVDDSGTPLTGARAKRCPAIDGRILDQLVREEALVVTPSVVVRRELIERVGGYDDHLLVCEDYELWVRLASCSEVDFIDEPLVLVRRHREHSFDDITCLENLRHAVEIVQHSGAASHLDAVLNERRAKISANLARGHALCKSRLRVLTTLLFSVRYSWRYREWWRGALAATVLAFAPAAALSVVRKYRRGGRITLEPRT
jgi:glycosyltransferase involved in cell wall biosynthesis